VMPCVGDEDCPNPSAPFCDPSGTCMSCDGLSDSDEACAGLDPQTPLCIEEACVQCTTDNAAACGGETPLCDDTRHTCVSTCNTHAQCGAAACDMITGECFPEDAVVHVGPAQDFSTIGSAIASFATGAQGTIIIHPGSYSESVVIDDDRRLALLAVDGHLPIWGGSGAAQLTVAASGTVFVEGLRFAGNTNYPGLSMNGGLAWLDRVQLVSNGVGAQLQGGADLRLRNCFLGRLTNDGHDAIQISASSATILYSTLIGDVLMGSGLLCDAGASVTVRNSIIVAHDSDGIACSQAEISFSATSGPFGGDGNQNVGTVNSWFVSPANFHIDDDGAAVFADIAQWQTGDPPIDIDGDARPNADGAPDYPGADVP
jgi:hypothetical protein